MEQDSCYYLRSAVIPSLAFDLHHGVPLSGPDLQAPDRGSQLWGSLALMNQVLWVWDSTTLLPPPSTSWPLPSRLVPCFDFLTRTLLLLMTTRNVPKLPILTVLLGLCCPTPSPLLGIPGHKLPRIHPSIVTNWCPLLQTLLLLYLDHLSHGCRQLSVFYMHSAVLKRSLMKWVTERSKNKTLPMCSSGHYI